MRLAGRCGSRNSFLAWASSMRPNFTLIGDVPGLPESHERGGVVRVEAGDDVGGNFIEGVIGVWRSHRTGRHACRGM